MLSACLGSQEATADGTQPEGKVLGGTSLGASTPKCWSVLKLQCWRRIWSGILAHQFCVASSRGFVHLSGKVLDPLWGEYLEGDCSDLLAANSLSRWWPFAIHNILWHSRTLQVGYSTTSKPPVSKPGLINPGWWFSMGYPQNHPRLVIKSLLEMPSASPALESNPGLWTTIADLGVHAGKAWESYNPTVNIFARSTSMIPSSTICRSVSNIHQHILRHFLKIGMLPTHWLHYWLIIT